MVFSRVIGKNLQGNFPGTIGRGGDQLVEAHVSAQTIQFGRALKLVGNKYELITTGDAETLAIAVSVRTISQSTEFLGQTDINEYSPNSDVDGILRGYISVEVADGDPVNGGQVYLINAPGDSGLNPGDFVATVTVGTGTTVAPANWFYRTTKNTANNVSEVHILTARI